MLRLLSSLQHQLAVAVAAAAPFAAPVVPAALPHKTAAAAAALPGNAATKVNLFSTVWTFRECCPLRFSFIY